MGRLTINVIHEYKFVKGGDCSECSLFDLCTQLDDVECELGTVGHYECVGEDIEYNYEHKD